MANGEPWAAIAEVRTQGAKHEREIGVLDSRVGGLKEDVNSIGEETRKARIDLAKLIADSEARTNERLDRLITTGRWVIGLSIPAICTLAGVLIGKS